MRSLNEFVRTFVIIVPLSPSTELKGQQEATLVSSLSLFFFFFFQEKTDMSVKYQEKCILSQEQLTIWRRRGAINVMSSISSRKAFPASQLRRELQCPVHEENQHPQQLPQPQRHNTRLWYVKIIGVSYWWRSGRRNFKCLPPVNPLVSDLSALSPNSQCVRISQEHTFIVQTALRVSSEFVWSLVQTSQTPHVNNFCYRRLYCQTRRT